VKFAFIAGMAEEGKRKPREERFPVVFMCEMLEVSRQGYYAWKKRPPSARAAGDEKLAAVIAGIHEENKGRYGIDRICRELARRGHRAGPRRVRRLARAAGLACVHPRPYKATTVQDAANASGLVDLAGRALVPEARNQLWYGDITYIFTMAGWAYMATVIDGYSRKVVGWAVADHMREELVVEALMMALASRNPGIGEVVFHSDRGSQYTGRAFRGACLANGVIPSVGHTGVCFDNAAAQCRLIKVRGSASPHIHRLTRPGIVDNGIKVALYGLLALDWRDAGS
jgi:transposase InsO family protein